MEKKTQEKKKKRKVNSQVLLNTQLLTYKQGRMYFFYGKQPFNFKQT